MQNSSSFSRQNSFQDNREIWRIFENSFSIWWAIVHTCLSGTYSGTSFCSERSHWFLPSVCPKPTSLIWRVNDSFMGVLPDRRAYFISRSRDNWTNPSNVSGWLQCCYRRVTGQTCVTLCWQKKELTDSILWTLAILKDNLNHENNTNQSSRKVKYIFWQQPYFALWKFKRSTERVLKRVLKILNCCLAD